MYIQVYIELFLIRVTRGDKIILFYKCKFVSKTKINHLHYFWSLTNNFDTNLYANGKKFVKIKVSVLSKAFIK